jgi:O-antigen/teichoic acid export membrane protein
MSELSLRRLVLKNTGVLGASQVAVMATQLATTLILSRYLGAEGFGQYSYVFAFYMLFLAVNDLGITTVAVRDVAQRRDEASEIISGLLSLRVLLAAGSMLVAWAVIWRLGTTPELRTALALFALILPLTALQLPLTVFRVELKPEYPAAVGVVSRILGLGFIAALVWLHAGVVAMIAAYLAAELLYVLGGLHYARRLVRLTWRVDPSLWSRAVRAGIVVGFINFFAMWINRLDFLMLERMTTLAQVGLYAAAYRVTNTAEALPLLVMGSIYPLLARHKEEPDRLRRIYQQSLLYLSLLGLLMGVAVTAVAPWLVPLLFGPGYEGATAALRALVWSSVCVYVFLTSNNLLLSVGRERRLLVLYAMGAGLNLVLNLLWIPRFGIVGAALATTASYAAITIGSTLSALGVLRESASPQILKSAVLKP